MFAGGARQELPKGLGTEAGARNEVEYSRRRYTPKRRPFLSCYHLHVFIYVVFERFSERFKDLKGKNVKRSRDWIVEKKERRRRQGRSVLSHPILSISLLLHKLLLVRVFSGRCEQIQSTRVVDDQLHSEGCLLSSHRLPVHRYIGTVLSSAPRNWLPSQAISVCIMLCFCY